LDQVIFWDFLAAALAGAPAASAKQAANTIAIAVALRLTNWVTHVGQTSGVWRPTIHIYSSLTAKQFGNRSSVAPCFALNNLD